MKFKTDENLPIEAADLQRSAGHDTACVLRAVARTITLFSSEEVAGRLWIVEEHQVRIHGE